MERVLVIILAGGAGERLRPLTEVRSKAAVSFGGKYRLIDFVLSNCINSELKRIIMLTQYSSESLHRHVQDGWGISAGGFGDYVYCVPPQFKNGEEWYRGTADAIRKNLGFLKTKDFDDVLILAGDHIYKMNYNQLISYHRAKNAELTVAAMKVKKEQAAGRLGVLEIDKNCRLIDFEEKPAEPRTVPGEADYAVGSMGIYLFKIDYLLQALQGQEEDFGKQIIPVLAKKGADVFAYDYEKENKISDIKIEVRDGTREKVLVERSRDSSYWRDVGTIDSYYEASMDLVGIDPIFNLYGEKWPFRTISRRLPPSKFLFGSRINDSIVSDGCIISGGAVWNSVLSPGVIVEKDAVIEQSIIFDDVIVEPGARIRRAIIDKDSRIQAGASIGYDTQSDRSKGCFISDNGIVVIPYNTEISP